jgi:hypothetical protein
MMRFLDSVPDGIAFYHNPGDRCPAYGFNPFRRFGHDLAKESPLMPFSVLRPYGRIQNRFSLFYTTKNMETLSGLYDDAVKAYNNDKTLKNLEVAFKRANYLCSFWACVADTAMALHTNFGEYGTYDYAEVYENAIREIRDWGRIMTSLFDLCISNGWSFSSEIYDDLKTDQFSDVFRKEPRGWRW